MISYLLSNGKQGTIRNHRVLHEFYARVYLRYALKSPSLVLPRIADKPAQKKE